MGAILSRFRSKTTTKEVLESLEKDIKNLESVLKRNRELQKNIVLSLVLFSMLTYIISAVIFYIWFLPENWSDRAIWILPFVGFPFLVVFLKKILHFIFVTRINKNAKEIENLQEKKKKILEDITEKETYKVAKELLERFDPHGKIIARDSATTAVSPKRPNSEQELRYRHNAVKTPQSNGRPIAQGHKATSMPVLPMMPPGSPINSPQMRNPGQTPPPRASPLVGNRRSEMIQTNLNGSFPGSPDADYRRTSLPNCPILPRERSFFDKVAEYFVGDGPGYRYALICSRCHSHNGMALPDEFKYIEFRCAYCGFVNPARDKKPNAPSLEEDRKPTERENVKPDDHSHTDQSDKQSSNEDEDSHQNEDGEHGDSNDDDPLNHSEDTKPDEKDSKSNKDNTSDKGR